MTDLITTRSAAGVLAQHGHACSAKSATIGNTGVRVFGCTDYS